MVSTSCCVAVLLLHQYIIICTLVSLSLTQRLLLGLHMRYAFVVKCLYHLFFRAGRQPAIPSFARACLLYFLLR